MLKKQNECHYKIKDAEHEVRTANLQLEKQIKDAQREIQFMNKESKQLL